jgi:hypothetical protein
MLMQTDNEFTVCKNSRITQRNYTVVADPYHNNKDISRGHTSVITIIYISNLSKINTLDSLTTLVANMRPLIFELPKKNNFSTNFCPLSQPRLTPTS